MRKKNNGPARMQRFTRALLSQHGVVVVHVDCCGDTRQGVWSWKSMKNVKVGPQLATAITDFAHDWTFTVNLMWLDRFNNIQITWLPVPAGRHKSETLAGLVESEVWKARSEINPNWTFLGYGWIANPAGDEFSEKDAETIFESIHAYDAAYDRRRMIKALEAA